MIPCKLSSKEAEECMDEVYQSSFGMSRTEAIKGEVCAACSVAVGPMFEDQAEAFARTGFCPTCQKVASTLMGRIVKERERRAS